jgi:transmembrane sensor
MDMQRLLWEEVLRNVNSGQQPTADQWHALSPDERELIESLQKQQLTAHSVEFLDSINEDKVWLKLNENLQRQHPRRVVRMRFLRYAAVFAGLLMLGASVLLLLKKNEAPQPVTAGKYITDPVNPKRAMLVLADGRSIELNKTPDAKIRQEQAEIINIDTSILRYIAATGTIKPAAFNTLIVPRGGLYKVELADGSEVWLNAETKLRYPVHFGGVAKREVFLESGEAYFKVTPNAAQPFMVKAGEMDVTVLGTEFNVNTYTKNYATTLAHGSVKLSSGTTTAMLQPGEQTVYAEGKFTRRVVDVDTYTAWKDGQIILEEAPLEEVMNSLGRQYDFTFEFTSPQLRERKFGGRLRRTEHIEDVLTVIEKAGYVKFSIKGKTIFVSPVMSN